MVILLPVAEVWIGNRSTLKIRLVLVQGHQLVWVRERQRAQQHAIDHGEQRGIGSDAQSQSHHRHRREPRTLHQHAKAVAQIVEQSFHVHLKTLFVAQRHHGIDLGRAPCR